MKLPASYLPNLLAHRKWILAGVVAITIPCVYLLAHVHVATSVLQMYMSDDSAFREYFQRAQLLGGDTDALIFLATDEGDQLFTAETFNRIREVTGKIEALPEVQDVTSLSKATRTIGRKSTREIAGQAVLRSKILRGDVPGPLGTPPLYWPRSQEMQAKINLKDLKARMTSDPLLSRTLLSKDGSGQCMMIRLKDPDSMAAREQYYFLQKLTKLVTDNHLGASGVYSSGFISAQAWTFEQVTQALMIWFPVGGVIIGVIVYILLRRVSLVFLTLTISVVAIIWAMGTTVFFYHTVSVLMAAVPLMVLVMSTSDTIHLASAYLAELDTGHSHDDALRKMTEEVGGACVLTSLTTFVGFFSLMLVPSATTRHFALASSVGVASALLLTLVFVPITLDFMRPTASADRAREDGFASRMISAFLAACCRCSLKYSGPIFWFSLFAVTMTVWCCRDLKMDPNLLERFRDSHHVHKSADFFNQQFSGNSILEIYFKAPADRLLAPETVEAIDRFEKASHQLPHVISSYSVASLLQAGGRGIGFGTVNNLPPTFAAANAFLDFASHENASAVLNAINRREGLTRVLIRSDQTSLVAARDLSYKLAELARTHLPPDIQVDAAGSCAVLGDATLAIIRGQFQGFQLCLILVTVTLSLGLRSIRMALIAVLPNVLPLVMLVGCLRLTGPTTDTDTLGIAIISLGLAVDDTIHFMHRYMMERKKGASISSALEVTFHFTGAGILRTTIVLSLGFLPFAFSGYFSLWMLGTYLVLVLNFAVLGDLLLLPAMIKLFDSEPKTVNLSTHSSCERPSRRDLH